MVISRYVCVFMLYSFLGWIWETIFCTLLHKKWENRGFLYGPICPIYGVGAVTIMLITTLMRARGAVPSPWQIFIISVLGSAVLEYVTSWGLEKLFHALWWDYSAWPLNLHGRISLFTSLGFGAGGLAIVYWLAPFTEELMGRVPPLMVELLSLVSLSLLMADLTLTVTVLHHFDQTVTRLEDSLNRNMGQLVDSAVQKTSNLKHELSARQKLIGERLGAMGGVAQSALRRVRSFRFGGEKARESVGALLSFVRKKKE